MRRSLPHTLRRTIVATALACAVALSAGAQANKSMRVLFIGNSYTYFNNLPVTILDLTQSRREERFFMPVVVLVGGSTLERHLAGADALSASGAKVVMYETWAKEATPQLQDSLSRSYHRAAQLAGGSVAHVGEAWAAFRATEQIVAPAHSTLFFTDGSHPSTAGTYLAACVLYATLYGKSPEGLPNTVRSTHQQPEPGPALTDSPRDSISAPLAATLQKLAWKAAAPK